MIRKLNTLILIGLIGMISSTTAYATRSCIKPKNGVPENIIQSITDRSDFIFIGKVQSLQRMQAQSSRRSMYVAEVEVNEWVKGEMDHKIVNVVSPIGGGFCYGFYEENIGDQVKVYISKGADPEQNRYLLRLSEIINP